jgi:hypothetical protein
MSRDPAPYDVGQPFDADRFLDGFTEEEGLVPVDPDSPLGRAMAAARQAWATPDYVPIDPDTFKVEPIPVELDDEEMPPARSYWRFLARTATHGPDGTTGHVPTRARARLSG